MSGGWVFFTTHIEITLVVFFITMSTIECDHLGCYNKYFEYLKIYFFNFIFLLLKPLFDLGEKSFPFYSFNDDESVRQAIAGSDIVINLVGKHYETKHIVPTRRSDGSLSRLVRQAAAFVCKEFDWRVYMKA